VSVLLSENQVDVDGIESVMRNHPQSTTVAMVSMTIASMTITLFVLSCAPTRAQNQRAQNQRAPQEVPQQLRKWLQPQEWNRDTDGPVLRLGHAGEFDYTHLFAPCVAVLDDVYHLWCSGSTGTVANRVFEMGLATSEDGRTFSRHSTNPVYRFGDQQHSVLTPTLLRRNDGTPLRENGKFRMWFSSTHFSGGTGHHALYETRSVDGVDWEQPSEPLLEHVYSPTILKDNAGYHMWYTDVSGATWVFRYAVSSDGRTWRVHPDPVFRPKGYEVIAAGDHIRTFINGQPCVNLEDPEGATRGIIAFQLHSGGKTEVRFRNIQLAVLSPDVATD
jgi:hypothetical protein